MNGYEYGKDYATVVVSGSLVRLGRLMKEIHNKFCFNLSVKPLIAVGQPTCSGIVNPLTTVGLLHRCKIIYNLFFK